MNSEICASTLPPPSQRQPNTVFLKKTNIYFYCIYSSFYPGFIEVSDSFPLPLFLLRSAPFLLSPKESSVTNSLWQWKIPCDCFIPSSLFSNTTFLMIQEVMQKWNNCNHGGKMFNRCGSGHGDPQCHQYSQHERGLFTSFSNHPPSSQRAATTQNSTRSHINLSLHAIQRCALA